MRDEQDFCSKLILALRNETKFAYKIADTLGQKFTPSKPFDLFTVIYGTAIAIEAKFLESNESLRYKLLRPAQIIGLEDWQQSGGASFVAASFPTKHGYFALLVDYSELKKREAIKPTDFFKYSYCYALKEGKFDLSHFAKEMRYYF